MELTEIPVQIFSKWGKYFGQRPSCKIKWSFITFLKKMKTAMTPQFSFLVMVTVLVLNHHSIITLSSQGLDGRQTPLPKPGGNNFWQLSHYSATSQTLPSVLGMSYLFMGWSGNLGGKLLLRNYGGAVLFRWLKGGAPQYHPKNEIWTIEFIDFIGGWGEDK